MQGRRDNQTCSFCTQNFPTAFCACLGSPMLLCDACIGPHYSKFRTNVHEMCPIEALDYFSVPGYTQSLKQRQQFQIEAINKLKTNLANIQGWQRDICEAAEFMIAQLTTFRQKVETEMANLLKRTEADIETGIQEFQQKFFEVQPVFNSPIAQALRSYESGNIVLFSCQTNFEDVKKSFEGFLFTVNVYLQAEIPGYEPVGIIKTEADLSMHKTVNIYQRTTAVFSTPEAEATHRKFGDFPQPINAGLTIKRGPITFPSGKIYTGDWNQQNAINGFGHYLFRNGQVYTGQIVNKYFHGKGREILANGQMYEGEFESGKMQGFGKFYWPEGHTYIGQHANSKLQGVGCKVNNEASQWLCSFGEFSNDGLEGRGVKFGKDGSIFAGYFKAWKLHGKGLVFEKGQCFYGDFIDGVKVQP